MRRHSRQACVFRGWSRGKPRSSPDNWSLRFLISVQKNSLNQPTVGGEATDRSAAEVVWIVQDHEWPSCRHCGRSEAQYMARVGIADAECEKIDRSVAGIAPDVDARSDPNGDFRCRTSEKPRQCGRWRRD